MCATVCYRCGWMLLWGFLATGIEAAETAETLCAAARQQCAARNWAAAEKTYSQVLSQFPDDPQANSARFHLAEAIQQQGRYQESRKQFLHFLDSSPDHPSARLAQFRAAEAAYLAGQAAEARSELERFRQRFPTDPSTAYVLSYLAELALSGGDRRAAQELYSQAVKQFPDSPIAPECRFGLGRAREALGDPAGAEREYQTLVKEGGRLTEDGLIQIGILRYNQRQFTQAATAFREALTKFPNSQRTPQAEYWLGMSHVARGAWAEAAQTLESAAASHTRHALAPAMMYWAGEALRRRGETEVAKTYFEVVSSDWPDSEWADDSLWALLQIAFEANDAKQVQKLAERFEAHYQASPLRPQVRQWYGRLLLRREDYAAAAELFRSLLSSASDKPAAGDSAAGAAARDALRLNHYYLAVAALGVQQYQEAFEALGQVQPRDAERELRLRVLAAQAQAQLGLRQYAAAIASWQQYLASGPPATELAGAHLLLALSLARSGHWEEGLRQYDAVKQPDLASTAYLEATAALAEAAYEASRFDVAKRLFTALTKSESTEAWLAQGLSGLGWTGYQLREFEPALAAFARLAKKYPTSPLAAEAAMMEAKLHEKVGRLDRAAQAYLAAAAKHAEADEAAPALLEAARLLTQLHRPQEAVTALRQIIAFEPACPQRAAALYQLGWTLEDLKQAEASDATFQQLADEHRDSSYWADATYRLAERAARGQQRARAEALVHQLLDAQPEPQLLVRALYLSGQLAAAAERWEAVAEAMQKVRDQTPDAGLQLSAEYWIAESYYRRAAYDQAEQRFASLAQRVADRRDTWLAVVPLRRAQILLHRQQWPAAYRLAADIAGRFPGFRQQFEADYVLGRCLLADGKFGAAREKFESAMQAAESAGSETVTMSQWMIGESHFQQRQWDAAVRAYLQIEALTSDPRWRAAALLQAGKCRAHQGNSDEAGRLLAQVVKEHSQTASAAEASQQLQQLDLKREAKHQTEPGAVRR